MAVRKSRRTSRDTGPVQSVTRALELIDALQRVESAEVGDLAGMHGVHRSTTLRLLQTLERFGYVTRGQARGEFRRGLRLYELGLAASEQRACDRRDEPPTRLVRAEAKEDATPGQRQADLRGVR